MWLILVGEGTVFIMIEVKKLISAIFFSFFFCTNNRSLNICQMIITWKETKKGKISERFEQTILDHISNANLSFPNGIANDVNANSAHTRCVI